MAGALENTFVIATLILALGGESAAGADEPQASQATPSTGCLKVVFEVFCLGGAEATLPNPHEIRGNTRRWYPSYPSAEGAITVEVDAGRVVQVLKLLEVPLSPTEKGGSWREYERLLGLLTQKYGEPHNFSRFPENARTKEAQAASIRAREGVAVHQWPQSGWFVRLAWGSNDGIVLGYSDLEWAVREEKKRLEDL